MASTSTKVGHGLAKALGIKLNYRSETHEEDIKRGDSVYSVSSADAYVEEEPRSIDWIREVTPGSRDVFLYFKNLFPFLQWLPRYNLQWLVGDLVAGITVGAVVVPQGMSYATLALLHVQFGLYTAFMGVLIYWIFGTSKDITIGPVAVVSTLVGNVLLSPSVAAIMGPVNGTYHRNEVVGCLAIISGSVIAFLGFARLGWIVDFISATAVSAFITGAAISIGCGQVANLIGISSDYVNTHGPTYLVIIDTLKALPHAGLAAAMGISALVLLYSIRFACNYSARRFPSKAKLFFFLSTLRTVFTILLFTLISWLVNRNIAGGGNNSNARFSILGTVPRGFTHARVPTVNKTIIKAFASFLPAMIIVLLIEHIAISKSFGRINNYTINPSQELTAIGVTNLLGPFLGAYPATGSFSRTAINSKAGVRTPLGGVITAIVVLLAIYALPAVFYWVPSAGLSAVIIHAVGDLITPPNTVYQFWRVSPFEVFIFFAGVIVTVFSTIEDGIYTTICISIAILLFRLAKARGRFLGKVTVHSVVGDHLAQPEADDSKYDYKFREKRIGGSDDGETAGRTVFLPLDHRDGSNPNIELKIPYPGIFIYRFSEGFNYPNSSHYLEHLVQTIFAETRRTDPNNFVRPGDRPWNVPGPRRGDQEHLDMNKPTLKAVILDFSSVNNVDVTVVQNLIDVRNQLDRYANPDPVEWHIACINNRWTKRALVASGFGYPTPESANGELHRWKPIFSVAEFGGHNSAAETAEDRFNARRRTDADLEDGITGFSKDSPTKAAVVHGMNRPFFHLDVMSALQSAIASVERRTEAIASRVSQQISRNQGQRDLDRKEEALVGNTQPATNE